MMELGLPGSVPTCAPCHAYVQLFSSRAGVNPDYVGVHSVLREAVARLGLVPSSLVS
jgi:hypothetical protein